MPNDNRPLSPHLQVYRPQMTSVLSILHRITGVILSVASLILVYWLAALAAGPEAFARAEALLHGWIGIAILIPVTLALFYHLCAGIRHLVWDAGVALTIKGVYVTGWTALATTLLLTLIFWVVVI
ncbi:MULTISPECIES: succinate dehydrogenase, cytochrome b556 subunit [Ectothiorhodospira]|uniref:succinate dehydrogenase, cytochrome b556 subunit n=1 Tax=Ectothiorhodospira TaxID=1051 RepID=UPI00024A8170|nr:MULTISPECIES: succinate dehydrogenase, cytochrome b556 subunit [Ectothiorhodospira]EHQ53220.1 succinate dehydrogenase subunit C [Ectothiorhodospira sp. PHS-1]MCG5514280.1 succinate dehydrogenase, cytochrome b556 subunit [Ectothiorhodospira shaposhnikovii]